MASGKFISDSFADWEEDPIVTTMDSIAAPIRELQFPTVTVCPEKNKPPDNWAALEVLLNFVAYECDTSPYHQSKLGLPPCNITKEARNDFGYLFESSVRHFIETLKESNLTLSTSAIDKFKVTDSVLVSDIMPQLASFLEEKALEEGFQQVTSKAP